MISHCVNPAKNSARLPWLLETPCKKQILGGTEARDRSWPLRQNLGGKMDLGQNLGDLIYFVVTTRCPHIKLFFFLIIIKNLSFCYLPRGRHQPQPCVFVYVCSKHSCIVTVYCVVLVFGSVSHPWRPGSSLMYKMKDRNKMPLI